MPDATSFSPWGAAANIAGGLIGAGIGALQRRAGKKYLQKLGDFIPEDELRNQQRAQELASVGMPAEQYALAMKNIQRQQLSALRGANDRRSGANLIPYIQNASNDATLKLDSENAQQRLANERMAMQENSRVGAIKQSNYLRKWNYGNELLGAGNQNLSGGLDKLATGGLMIGSSGLLKKQKKPEDFNIYSSGWDLYQP